MDERAVFEQFHEALELEPRAGAYERFRAAFITPPATAKRRPVFRLRFSRMSLRVAAALAVVAIAIALVAGFAATHRPTASVPAASDPNVKAYQTMMRTDHAAFVASLSNNCADVNQRGCSAALGQILPPLQKWISDIDAFKKTPSRFAVIGAQVRQHATATLSDVNLAGAAVGARDNHALANALNAGAANATWLARATLSIVEAQQVKASDYIALVKADGDSLNVCEGCIAMAGASPPPCAGAQADVCMNDVIPADDTIGQMGADVIEQAAPASLAGKDQQLQADLAAADSALVKMLNALLAGESATFKAAQLEYRVALAMVRSDVTAITG